jgi:hypothetical protein
MAAMRTMLVLLGLVVCTTTVMAQTGAPAGSADLNGKLYKSVFSAGPGALQPADVQGLPEPLGSRLSRYLARRASFKSRYAHEPDTLDEMRADAKRRSLERAIVALVEAPGTEKAAAEFVSRAPIAPEWNGSDGPLREAAHAEDVLKKDPASPLAPWYYVFIAERQRIAFEILEQDKDEEGMKAAARKYRTFADRARRVDDPIFTALIEDLDRRPYLHVRSTNHPRDYDPDS